MMRLRLDRSNWQAAFAWVALGLAIATVVWFFVAAFGSRMRFWDPLFGFGTLAIKHGSQLAIASLILGGVALVLGFTAKQKSKPVILAGFAILLAGTVMGRLITFRGVAVGLPPIHDIQTDWSEPVTFSDTMLAAREADNARNPIEDDPVIPDAEGVKARWPDYAGMRVAEAQEMAEDDPTVSYPEGERPPYPQIEPIFADRPAEDVYGVVLDLVKSEGWDIVSEYPASAVNEGRIEATDTTGWFGFKDDVAIRIRPLEGDRTRIDMRSTSRVGLSDVGVNALRVSRFLGALERRLR